MGRASRAAVRRLVASGVVLIAIGGALGGASPAVASGIGRITGNWAGYEQKPPTGTVYTAVRATFVVPTVAVGSSCPGGVYPCKSSTWVGIGGDPDPLVQTGTEADLEQNGTAEYSAWTEIVPDNPNTQRRLSLTVRPGDEVTATVTETAANTWVMSVKDLATGKSGSRTVTNYPVPAASSSAEVIHERTGFAPLAPTTDVLFDHAAFATSAPSANPAWVPFFNVPAGATLYDEQMCSQKEPTASCLPPALIVATPSDADSDKDGFAVTDGASPPAPPPSAGPVFTAVTDPTISGPYGITAGPDGAMWFANFAASSVGRIAPDGTVTEYHVQGNSAMELTAGPDGALWFTNGTAIGRITVSGTITYYQDPRVAVNGGIASGPDGALWFTNFDPTTSRWSIGRVTTSGAFSFYYAPSLSEPYGITAGPDGALWFTNRGSCNHTTTVCGSIGRITTSGAVSSYRTAHVNYPGFITAGPDGALWFTNDFDYSIGRITTAGVISFHYVKPGGMEEIPQDITAGPDGALWFVMQGSTEIGRITTSGHMSFYNGSASGYPSGEWEIAAGPDRTLWSTNPATGPPYIFRITIP